MVERVGRTLTEVTKPDILHSLRLMMRVETDNMDIRRLATITDRDAERLRRYLAAWRALSGAANG